jgi:hypothetical protein
MNFSVNKPWESKLYIRHERFGPYLAQILIFRAKIFRIRSYRLYHDALGRTKDKKNYFALKLKRRNSGYFCPSPDVPATKAKILAIPANMQKL